MTTVTSLRTARWLQSIVRRHFDGQHVIVVSNREPCVHEVESDGSIAVRHPISGLVTALDEGPAEPGLLPAELFSRISPVA